MHVVVFTRSTPDTRARVEVAADGSVTWGDAEIVVNPWDEYALAEAIGRAKDAGGKVTVIAIGGEFHTDALRYSLSVGADEAVRIDDLALDPDDSLSYALAAAAAVRKLGDVALVVCGKESVNVGTDAHIIQLARKLGWTMLSYVSRIDALDPAAGTLRVERMLEQGRQVVSGRLPAVLTVLKDIAEPRNPTVPGIRKANRATIPVWSLADLGLSLPTASTRRLAFRNLPARETQTEMLTGTPAEQAAQLVERLMQEQVL